MMRDGVEVKRGSTDYFELVLEVEDVGKANTKVSGDWRMPSVGRMGELNERAISKVEGKEAVNEMKSGKAPALDGFPVGCLKNVGMAVLE